MKKFKGRYDGEVDAMYLATNSEERIARSVVRKREIVFDLDQSGDVVGIEILGVMGKRDSEEGAIKWRRD